MGYKEVLGLIPGKKKELIELTLFNRKKCNGFQEFLIKSRVQPFQMLFVLENYFGAEARVGYERVEYSAEGENDEYETIMEKENCLVMTKYVGKEMFNHLLENLSFKAVEIPFYQNPEYELMKTKDGPFEEPEEAQNTQHSGELIILTDPHIVIDSGKIYAEKEEVERIQKILDKTEPFFELFIASQEDAVGVSHDIYVDWLHQWFPTKISIRTLT